MTTAAIEYLEARYERTAAILAKVRRGESLSLSDRALLREACVEAPLGPPIPVAGYLGTAGWTWKAGDEAGPLDGRAHP